MEELQRQLGLLGARIVADGLFGRKTEEAVLAFQASTGLYADGIVGGQTRDALAWALREHGAVLGVSRPEPCRRRMCGSTRTAHRDGYSSFRLRDDVATAYQAVRAEVVGRGGIITSSGGMRALGAKVSANRSATSMHYVGRALDLFVYSAKVDPATDPYVVVPDPDRERGWVVYARVEDGERMSLDAMTWERTLVPTEGVFINLTTLFRREGFEPIRARRSFWPPRSVNGQASGGTFSGSAGWSAARRRLATSYCASTSFARCRARRPGRTATPCGASTGSERSIA